MSEAARRIECVRRRPTNGNRSRITHIGGVNPDGSPWMIPLEQAIREVESGQSNCFSSTRMLWMAVAVLLSLALRIPASDQLTLPSL